MVPPVESYYTAQCYRQENILTYFSEHLEGRRLVNDSGRPVVVRHRLGWEVYYLSTASYGAGLSRSLLPQIIVLFHVSVSPVTLSVLTSIVRTLAHLTEYCILC